jgi:uncharacterized membrane protein
MSEIYSQEDYDNYLKDLTPEQIQLRFEKILDIRKFEIELYWKRATYFWAFIVVAFTAYGLTIDKPNAAKFQFLATCVGLLFSIAFYMVNKASKFWQENWETHTDFSETKVIGPLYKITTPIRPKKDIMNPKANFSASVSRINIYISFVLIIIWSFLMVGFCIENLRFTSNFRSFDTFYYTLLLPFTIYSCYFILFETTTGLWESSAKFIVR